MELKSLCFILESNNGIHSQSCLSFKSFLSQQDSTPIHSSSSFLSNEIQWTKRSFADQFSSFLRERLIPSIHFNPPPSSSSFSSSNDISNSNSSSRLERLMEGDFPVLNSSSSTPSTNSAFNSNLKGKSIPTKRITPISMSSNTLNPSSSLFSPSGFPSLSSSQISSTTNINSQSNQSNKLLIAKPINKNAWGNNSNADQIDSFKLSNKNNNNLVKEQSGEGDWEENLISLYVFLIRSGILFLSLEMHLLFKVISGPSLDILRSKKKENLCFLIENPIKFCCKVLEALGDVVFALGPHILPLIIINSNFRECVPKFVEKLEEEVKMEAKFGVNGLPPIPDGKENRDFGTPNSAYSVPFSVEVESKNNFKTNEEQGIYNNREKSRDFFFELVREFAMGAQETKVKTFRGKEQSFSDRIAQFFALLMPCNYWWFCGLFESQLVQLCCKIGIDSISKLKENSINIGDPSLTKLAESNPHKLRMLEQRMSQRDEKNNSNISSFENSQKEEFFLRFLEAGNNYSFNVLVSRALGNRMNGILTYWSDEKNAKSYSDHHVNSPKKIQQRGNKEKEKNKPSNGMREMQRIRQFCDDLSELKVLSKFLAFLLFYSYGHKIILKVSAFSNSINDIIRKEDLLYSIYRQKKAVAEPKTEGFRNFEEIETGSIGTGFTVNLVQHLLKSSRQKSLIINLVWIHLFLVSLNNVSPHVVRKTEYVRDAIELLRLIYYQMNKSKSKRLQTGHFFIITEIETLFQRLEVDHLESDNKESRWPFTVFTDFETISNKDVNNDRLDFQSSLVENRSFIDMHWSLLREILCMMTKANARETVSFDSFPQLVNSNHLNQSKPTKKIAPTTATIPIKMGQINLRQWFFWQNPEIKQLCEFVGDKIEQNACQEIVNHVPQFIEKHIILCATQCRSQMEEGSSLSTLMASNWAQNIISEANIDAHNESISLIRSFCSEKILQSLQLLAPLTSDPSLISIAASLTSEHCISACQERVSEKIQNIVKQSIESQIKKIIMPSKSLKKISIKSPSSIQLDSNNHDDTSILAILPLLDKEKNREANEFLFLQIAISQLQNVRLELNASQSFRLVPDHSTLDEIASSVAFIYSNLQPIIMDSNFAKKREDSSGIYFSALHHIFTSLVNLTFNLVVLCPTARAGGMSEWLDSDSNHCKEKANNLIAITNNGSIEKMSIDAIVPDIFTVLFGIFQCFEKIDSLSLNGLVIHFLSYSNIKSVHSQLNSLGHNQVKKCFNVLTTMLLAFLSKNMISFSVLEDSCISLVARTEKEVGNISFRRLILILFEARGLCP
eukprot:TRINITY_DN4768_c0_g1_i8.p1 TRINITY_DN4768_c0_g1~~TRINITY_DN4768_c0_g1_i8.p1  ORF type:complete len:1300 (-),score=317.59 TRINITY_DN4768_c0_g1_i8:2258-6157(-)